MTTLQEAASEQVREDARKRVELARARLVLGKDAKSAFFATIALKLRTEAVDGLGTAATDGKRLLYDPRFFAALSEAEAIGVMCHEVLHCSNAHHARMGHREPRRWNIAADLAINGILLDAGFRLPYLDKICIAGRGRFEHLPSGEAAEWYYARLPEDAGGGGDGDGEEGGGSGDDPGGCGGVIQPGDGSEAARQQAEAEAQIATQQAQAAAKARGGAMPPFLGRMVENVLAPKVDWRAVLREFVTRQAKNDYTWSRPNRRHIAAGVYLPGLHSEELGDVVLALDTSGSIDRATLERFAAEVAGILEAYDCTLAVLYHHHDVYRRVDWQSIDGPLVIGETESGGTSHRPVFEAIEAAGIYPACIVCLTDLYTDFPADAPGCPVLWATTGSEQAPWGAVVKVEE